MSFNILRFHVLNYLNLYLKKKKSDYNLKRLILFLIDINNKI